MLFNSIDFAVFLPIVFAVYWMIGTERRQWQNAFLLLASYVFYGWWDYRFLILIFLSSLVDFLVGQKIVNHKGKGRKYWLWLSIAVNLGLLGFFKYFNFFIEEFISGFRWMGMEHSWETMHIILPVGISFYTFQTLSYTIDIYRGKLEASKDPISFFAYVSFFPQLVAGPIERAKRLLPQFQEKRRFNYELARDGTLQIIWGLFKKIVIADTCAIHANYIFEHHQEVNSSTLLLGIIYFLIQVYCDFSGYSDMAIGLGKLFGFRLMKNFDFPLFSRDIPEFWRKWHISLTSWFVDYVYIPLGGSRYGLWKKIRNVLIIFLVSGFWHGANWTFILWGLFCGLAFIPYLVTGNNRNYVGTTIAQGKLFPSFKELSGMILVNVYICLSMVFFRSSDIQQAYEYFIGLFSMNFHPFDLGRLNYFPLIILLFVWEWFVRKKDHGLQIEALPHIMRWSIYAGVIWMILYYFGNEEAYIYFQF